MHTNPPDAQNSKHETASRLSRRKTSPDAKAEPSSSRTTVETGTKTMDVDGTWMTKRQFWSLGSRGWCCQSFSTIVTSRATSPREPTFRRIQTALSQLHKTATRRETSSSVVGSTSSGQLRRMIGLALLVLLIVGRSSAQSAIPERYDGFVLNGVAKQGRSPVVWEVFIDPMCRNSKAGWPAVMQVAERYAGSSLVVVVHLFPAPFHHNAFFAARALHIAQRMNASLVYPLLELVYMNQETFSNPSTKNETPIHVISRLTSLAGELGVPANSFETGFNDVATDQATRMSFKYGCSRGVVATPTYVVNGRTAIGASTGWSVDDWGKIFDPMVQTPG